MPLVSFVLLLLCFYAPPPVRSSRGGAHQHAFSAPATAWTPLAHYRSQPLPPGDLDMAPPHLFTSPPEPPVPTPVSRPSPIQSPMPPISLAPTQATPILLPKEEALDTKAMSANALIQPIACVNGWASVDCVKPRLRHDTTFLFLLGFPYTGTSALHFVLGANADVSTLNDRHIFGGDKEGWRVPLDLGQPGGILDGGLFGSLLEGERWDARTEVPWPALRRAYFGRWNWSQPILLECSPPEVMHAQALVDTFSPFGDVRFILLVRSPRNLRRRLMTNAWSSIDALEHLRALAVKHASRSFVLRYEDICVDAARAGASLSQWLPGLSLEAVTHVPSKPSPHKSPLSVSEYCARAVQTWPLSPDASLDGPAAKVFGYA